MANIPPPQSPPPDESHGDFILPGLRDNPVAVTKWMLLLVLAYSREWNSRRLEHHFYGIWNSVFTHLTSDQAMLLVIPQHKLFFLNHPKDQGDTSIASYTEKNAKEAIPDFAIVCLRHAWRNSAPLAVRSFTIKRISTSWRHLKGEYAGVPVLIEIKRPAQRHVDKALFMQKLRRLMILAEEGVEKAAYHLFKNPKHSDQKSVILVACTGEWWIWRVATRAEIMFSFDGVVEPRPRARWDDDGDLDSDSEEERDGQGDEGEGQLEGPAISPWAPVPDEAERGEPDQATEATDDSSDNDDDDEPEGSGDEDDFFYHPMNHFTDIPGQAYELPDADDGWPTEEYSRFILLGSKASNQMFYLIHRRLEEVCAEGVSGLIPLQKSRG